MAAFGITAETMAAHKARWYVYTGEGAARIPWQATMRGSWPGFDVVCSCGWESRTGGGTRGYVREQLLWHRWDAQTERST